jgi:fructose/tagatose bisphosphate aldolase
MTGCHIIHALTHSLVNLFLSVDHARHLQHCAHDWPAVFHSAYVADFKSLETALTIKIACTKKLRADEMQRMPTNVDAVRAD